MPYVEVAERFPLTVGLPGPDLPARVDLNCRDDQRSIIEYLKTL